MQVYTYLFAIAILLGLMIDKNIDNATTNAAAAQVSTVNGSMLIYRNYVVTYATANPGVAGVVPDALLGLPSWFTKPSGINNYITAGKGYVYYSGTALPEMAYDLMKATNYSIYAGVNNNGILYSPNGGNTTIPLPPQIPNGSIVYGNG